MGPKTVSRGNAPPARTPEEWAALEATVKRAREGQAAAEAELATVLPALDTALAEINSLREERDSATRLLTVMREKGERPTEKASARPFADKQLATLAEELLTFLHPTEGGGWALSHPFLFSRLKQGGWTRPFPPGPAFSALTLRVDGIALLPGGNAFLGALEDAAKAGKSTWPVADAELPLAAEVAAMFYMGWKGQAAYVPLEVALWCLLAGTEAGDIEAMLRPLKMDDNHKSRLRRWAGQHGEV